jgi:hypothetical protein
MTNILDRIGGGVNQPTTPPSAFNGKTGRERLTKPFLSGPIPMDWLHTAGRINGRALHVAITLRFLAGVTKSKTVKLSQKHLEGFSIDRQTKRRALLALEAAGLISIENGMGKSPIITILEAQKAP